LENLHLILRVIAESKVVDEEPTVMRTESVNTLVVRLRPEKVNGTSLTLPTGSVHFPDYLGGRLFGVEDFVDVEVLALLCCVSGGVKCKIKYNRCSSRMQISLLELCAFHMCFTTIHFLEVQFFLIFINSIVFSRVPMLSKA